MGYKVRIQHVQRAGTSSFYVNFPVAVAESILAQKAEEWEWLVDSIVDHTFTGNSIKFHVLWETGEIMREPLRNCQDLAALDKYYELHGVTNWRDLSRQKE